VPAVRNGDTDVRPHGGRDEHVPAAHVGAHARTEVERVVGAGERLRALGA